MARNNLVGAWGEAEAAAYLRKKGYQIVAARYACRFGEIDLIARNRRFLAFVEVKVRKSNRFALAREYVNRPKQDRIRITASMYLQDHPTRLQPRFDIIELYAPDGIDTAHPVILHLEDAFQ